MIELPEARVLSGQIQQQLSGRRVERVTMLQSPHKFAWFSGDPEEYGSLLYGKRIDGAVAVGGQVEIHLENMRLLFGDGVRLRYHPAGDKLPDKHQLLLILDDDSALSASVQMYGGLWCYENGSNDNPYYLVALNKPTPYTPEFDEAYFNRVVDDSRREKPNLSIKGLLATEQRIPGLGNGVLQDILFHAALNPKKKVETLSAQQQERLFVSIKETLFKMALQGGRDTESDFFGGRGGYKTVLSSKTSGMPCPQCAGPIVKQAYMGGSVYFCPQCQSLD